MNHNALRLALTLACAALLGACSTFGKKSSLDSQAAAQAAADKAAAERAAKMPPAAEMQEASLRSRTYESSDDLKTVFFDLDSARFDDKALAIMKANAEKLKAEPNTALLLEGHADDRGTIAYNLALGQQRAQAVKEYYLSLGVPLRRMSTISYGELKPVCTAEDEACWGQNRRVNTKVGALDR
jgi:peptidoglycan-associated lipoprotein